MRMLRVLAAAVALAAGVVLAQTTGPATAPSTAPGTGPATTAAASAPAAPLVVTGEMPDTLKGKITDAVALIDAKKYVELLESLAPPEAVKEIKEGPKLQEFLVRMEEMGPLLRAGLVAAASQTPQMGTDAQGRVTATFQKPMDNAPELNFTMIDGNWTLR